MILLAVSTPVMSRTAPDSSAGPGFWPSSAQAAAMATTGASSTHGATWAEGYFDSRRLNTAYPTREHSPAV
jgi:hypothetical protein